MVPLRRGLGPPTVRTEEQISQEMLGKRSFSAEGAYGNTARRHEWKGKRKAVTRCNMNTAFIISRYTAKLGRLYIKVVERDHDYCMKTSKKIMP
jgi:hypothetical protein